MKYAANSITIEEKKESSDNCIVEHLKLWRSAILG